MDVEADGTRIAHVANGTYTRASALGRTTVPNPLRSMPTLAAQNSAVGGAAPAGSPPVPSPAADAPAAAPAVGSAAAATATAAAGEELLAPRAKPEARLPNLDDRFVATTSAIGPLRKNPNDAKRPLPPEHSHVVSVKALCSLPGDELKKLPDGREGTRKLRKIIM